MSWARPTSKTELDGYTTLAHCQPLNIFMRTILIMQDNIHRTKVLILMTIMYFEKSFLHRSFCTGRVQVTQLHVFWDRKDLDTQNNWGRSKINFVWLLIEKIEEWKSLLLLMSSSNQHIIPTKTLHPLFYFIYINLGRFECKPLFWLLSHHNGNPRQLQIVESINKKSSKSRRATREIFTYYNGPC